MDLKRQYTFSLFSILVQQCLHHLFYLSWFVILGALSLFRGLLLFLKLYSVQRSTHIHTQTVTLSLSLLLFFQVFPRFSFSFIMLCGPFRTFKTLFAIFLVYVYAPFYPIIFASVVLLHISCIGGYGFSVIFTKLKLLTCSCLPLLGYLQWFFLRFRCAFSSFTMQSIRIEYVCVSFG